LGKSHACFDTIALGFVTAACNYASAHSDRNTLKFGVIALFNGSEKRINIEMNDGGKF
jgi:hypothetical protein